MHSSNDLSSSRNLGLGSLVVLLAGGLLLFLSSSNSPSSSSLPNLPVRFLQAEDTATDDQLPEGVDFSEGGWATDYAASIISFLFFFSSLYSRNSYVNHQCFRWMHLGTGIAHLFGGMAHRYFMNRAADGVGQVGFYVMMMFGYTGNIMRYSLGWGLQGYWPKFGVVNWLFLIATGIGCIIAMERTIDSLDDADSDTWYTPDLIFVLAETVVAFCEVVTSFIYLWKHRSNRYAICACVINLVGWFSVYGGFFVSSLIGSDYDSALMQRIFHYCMIVMMWAINAIAVESPKDKVDDEKEAGDADEPSGVADGAENKSNEMDV